jgi:hypothetical protein
MDQDRRYRYESSTAKLTGERRALLAAGWACYISELCKEQRLISLSVGNLDS